jgi:hypothetical protein
MSDVTEFERIPASIAVSTMMQKIIDWRNFFMTLAIENGMKMDGIEARDGWQLNLTTGHWQRPKPLVNNATERAQESASDGNREP